MALARLAIALLALGAGPPARPPDHVGYVVYYAEDVMEGRAAANDPNYATAPAPCYVSYTLARDKDMAQLWLRIKAPFGTITCMVVDLPDDSKGHRQPLKDRKVWAEIGWRERWICGKHWTGRAKDCRVQIWVVERPGQRSRRAPTTVPTWRGGAKQSERDARRRPERVCSQRWQAGRARSPRSSVRSGRPTSGRRCITTCAGSSSRGSSPSSGAGGGIRTIA